MSPELRAMLEAKHAARKANELLPLDTNYAKQQAAKKRERSKKRKPAKRKAKKANVGIRTMKELELALSLKKHGKPTVKRFKVKY